MMTIYRITRLSRKDDLSGIGSAKFPGRWNRREFPVIYCSESVSGAYLELLAYLGDNFPQANPAILLYIQLPANETEEITIDQLPQNWREYPYPTITKDLGCEWLKSKKSLALRVPSALAPKTYNILLNPRHSEFNKVQIIKHHPISFDLRFFKGN